MSKLIKAYMYLAMAVELTIIYSDTILPKLLSNYFLPRSFLGIIGIYILSLYLLVPRNRYDLKGTKTVFSIIGIYILFITLRNISYLPEQISYFITSYKRWLFIIVVIYVISISIKSKDDIERIILFAILVLTISAVMAIMQFFDIEYAWQIRTALGGFSDLEVEKQVLAHGRIMGLAFYAIPFAYSLATLIPLNYAMLMIEKRHNIRIILVLCFLVLSSALLLSKVRAAVIGTGLSLIYILYMQKKKPKFIIYITIALIIYFIALYSSGPGDIIYDVIFGRYTLYHNLSTAGRIPLMILAVIVIYNNPLGIGLSKYSDVIVDYALRVRGFEFSEIIYETSPHNQILTTSISIGWIGIILISILYRDIYRKTTLAIKHSKDYRTRMLACGMIASFIGYFVCSMFHNAGPLTGHVLHWIFIALAISLYRVVHRQLTATGKST